MAIHSLAVRTACSVKNTSPRMSRWSGSVIYAFSHPMPPQFVSPPPQVKRALPTTHGNGQTHLCQPLSRPQVPAPDAATYLPSDPCILAQHLRFVSTPSDHCPDWCSPAQASRTVYRKEICRVCCGFCGYRSHYCCPTELRIFSHLVNPATLSKPVSNNRRPLLPNRLHSARSSANRTSTSAKPRPSPCATVTPQSA